MLTHNAIQRQTLDLLLKIFIDLTPKRYKIGTNDTQMDYAQNDGHQQKLASLQRRLNFNLEEFILYI